MADQRYHHPRFRDMIIGGIAFAVLIGLLWNLPSVIKRVGDFFLYFPSQLGFVQRVTPKEISKITSPTLLEITKPGKYMVFMPPVAYLGEQGEVLLNITSHTTGEQIRIVLVERGLRPYDTPLAEGRPIFEFEIMEAGKYEITFANQLYDDAGIIAIVPDYTTGKEFVILFAYIIQIAILLIISGIVYYPYYQRYQARIKTIEAPQKKMQIKGQAFWDAEMRNDKKKTQKDND
jgi:hypothetical protein